MNYFTNLKNLKLKPKKIDEFILREPRLGDCENIASLYKNDFPEHILVKWGVLSNPEKVKEQISTENKKWIIAESKNRIIGSSALEVSEWNSAAEIERAVVAKDMRGNGIAKGMCRTLIDEVAEPIGVKYLFAHARGQEYGMQKSLQNCGFKVGGIMPVFYVNHNGREVREYFVYMFRFLNNGEKEVESFDNLISAAKAIKYRIEKQYSE